MEHKPGFTLMELMVVVAIIAFLAVLSVPTFMRFLAKAKRTEAYMNLHAIYAAEKAYWAEHGRYSDILWGEGGIGWRPEGYSGGGAQERFNYTYGFGGSEGRNYVTGKLKTPSSYLAKAYADDKGFIAVAVGDIDGDGVPDILTIDQYNTITVVQDDVAS
jgi:prepilin-type N-terminal cleavage/methylation domain-containing protein